jgi:hypothetical protein
MKLRLLARRPRDIGIGMEANGNSSNFSRVGQLHILLAWHKLNIPMGRAIEEAHHHITHA